VLALAAIAFVAEFGGTSLNGRATGSDQTSTGCGGSNRPNQNSVTAAHAPLAATWVGKFPSTLVATFSGGGYGWSVPTDPETVSLIPAAYQGNEIAWAKQWTIDHADICLRGAPEFAAETKEKLTAIGYSYFQSIRENTIVEDAEMRKKLLLQGKVNGWEDLFLHFNSDTLIDTSPFCGGTASCICEDKTSWVGIPLVGYTSSTLNSANGVGLDPDLPQWNVDVFGGSGDGVLYVGMPEKFDAFKVTVAGTPDAAPDTGSLIFEYAAGINPATMGANLPWVVGQQDWKALAVVDSTLNFKQSGVVSFSPPADWVWGTPGPALPGIPKTGWLLNQGAGRFFVRIRVGVPLQKPPLLAKIETTPWVTLATVAGKTLVKVPGWDPKNDLDGNGRVDDAEKQAPTYNANASARFIHEARVAQVCSLGQGYPTWGRYAPNLWNEDYVKMRTEATAAQYSKFGWSGTYNDNASTLLWGGFSSEPLTNATDKGPVVVSGGITAEGLAKGYGDGGVRDPQMALNYTAAFIDLWAAIKTATNSSWVGVNTIEPFNYPLMKAFIEKNTFDFLINENTIRAVSPYYESMGTSSLGLSKLWWIPALSKAGKKTVLTGYLSSTLDGLSNTKDGWDRRKEALLAVYYLWNVPGMTVFTPNAEKYTSPVKEENVPGLTNVSTYYKPGVPNDMALQPTPLLLADLGQPANFIPAGYARIPYLGCAPYDKVIYACNTTIGYSTDQNLKLPGFAGSGPKGSVPTIPTYLYYLYAKPGGAPGVPAYLTSTVTAEGKKLPADMVLARLYTKGLVLYRTSNNQLSTTAQEFQDYIAAGKAVSVSLPGQYRRVLPDGSLAKPSRVVALRGYEGAILLKY
jgi:hypothetical protein